MELHPGDSQYPAALEHCPDKPRTLWARGDLAILDSRRAWPSSARAEPPRTRNASRVSSRGRWREQAHASISGLARGVDAAAHHRRARGERRDGRRARHWTRRGVPRGRTRRCSARSASGDCSSSELAPTTLHTAARSHVAIASSPVWLRVTIVVEAGGEERSPHHGELRAGVRAYRGGSARSDRRAAGAGEQRAAQGRRGRHYVDGRCSSPWSA